VTQRPVLLEQKATRADSETIDYYNQGNREGSELCACVCQESRASVESCSRLGGFSMARRWRAGRVDLLYHQAEEDRQPGKRRVSCG